MVERDDAEIRAFIERFAAVLTDTGWQRMAARVFAALLVADSGRRTAAELTDLLRASPAAISGAVRYLAQLGLVGKEREPGTRRDAYVVTNDMWYQVSVTRDRTLLRYNASLAEGVRLLGEDSPAGRRLGETQAFFAFIAGEVAQIMSRWPEFRDKWLADLDARGTG